MSHNLNIDLKKRKDAQGKTFYVGKIKAPAFLTLEEGASFLVFISDEGCEQLQIAHLQEGKNKGKNKGKIKNNDDDDDYESGY